MPGLVLFSRRWSIGSDDIVVPAALLFACHLVQAAALLLLLATFDPEAAAGAGNATLASLLGNDGPSDSVWRRLAHKCQFSARLYTGIYLALLLLCLLVEFASGAVSLRGGILALERRWSVEYLLYARFGLFALEACWLTFGLASLVRLRFFLNCSGRYAPIGAMTAVVAVNWSVMLLVLLTVWCVFDRAGRSWVKLRRFQAAGSSLHGSQPSGELRRRTGSSRRRTWRHRRAVVQYERIWDRRFRRLFCCVTDDRSAQNTFADVARLFSDFFRDLDVVPSDIIAGLVLLRCYQKERAKHILYEGSKHVLDFMSGRPIYANTQFLRFSDEQQRREFEGIVHFMKLALAAYGCPMLAYSGNCLCLLCRLNVCRLRADADEGGGKSTDADFGGCCCCCWCRRYSPAASVAALLRQHGVCCQRDFRITHYCREVGVEKTPFYVGVDFRYRQVVVSVRGTLSLQDVLTDLRADLEAIPGGLGDDWFGHRGMVLAAVRIHRRLCEQRLIEQALSVAGGDDCGLLLTGHSLGAGTAVVLGLLLRPSFGSRVRVLAYSPPGGLLSLPAALYTRQFVTSIVVGKDAIARVGLTQLESLRSDLIRVIEQSRQPKWELIVAGLACCCCWDLRLATNAFRILREGLSARGFPATRSCRCRV